MSDEEKKAIEILKDREYDFDELYCTFRQSFIKPYDKSIGIILELIEKKSKEIEELKQKNKPQSDCEEPIERTEEMVNMRWVNHNYISKDKIKAKIEEYEQDVKDFEEYWSKDPRKFKKEKSVDYYKLEALKELLEKE